MQLLRNASIGTKVALAPVFAIVCLVVVAAVGLWGSLSGTRSLNEINQSRIPGLALAADMERRIAAINGGVNQSLVWEGAGVKAATIAALDKQIAADFKELAAFIDAQQANPAWTDADKTTLERIAAEFAKFRSAAGDTLDIKSTGLGAASGFITRGESSYRQLHRLIDELVKGQQSLTRAVVTDAEAGAARNQVITAIAVLVAIALSSAATWWCWRLIVGPLVRASEIASRVAKGDLQTPRMAIARDETGKVLSALCEVTASLNHILKDIKAAAGDIDAVSEEIASGNRNLSVRTEQASSALAQTAASLEQLTASVQLSAGNAKEADSLAKQAASFARDGGSVVGDAVQSMEEISTQSKRISEIVGVIDGIAFQTDILALNAAVEAARAGELGRGFAVVAGEVRTLAQRSATAAREIGDLIGSSVSQIHSGADKVRTAGGSMRRIVESIERVSVVVKEISNASAEQAAGIQQINLAVAEMDRTTQQNASMVQEASATARALKEQSHRLVTTISVFRTSEEEWGHGIADASTYFSRRHP
ncbi:methyl-accepting chemotaxis protein [Piscinibacter sp.]|uniref:methyl-accepting chemotaxis protein n=1 Tax=Piscinibacter sp. TaxID=1903157 RepID=UPI002F40DF7B